MNYIGRVSPWPDEFGGFHRDTGVAIITQSGNMAVNFTMTRRGLPVAGVFALGNQADVDIAQMLEAFATDERITAIVSTSRVCAIRSPSRPRRRSPVRTASRLSALKTGRSEQGAKVAMSHTIRCRCGLALRCPVRPLRRCPHDVGHGLRRNPEFPAPRRADIRNTVVSMSCSGGEAALVADMAVGRKVAFPPFNPPTKNAVAATLNEICHDRQSARLPHLHLEPARKADEHLFGRAPRRFRRVHADSRYPDDAGNEARYLLVTADAIGDAAMATGARAPRSSRRCPNACRDVAAKLSAQGVAPMAGLDDALTAFEAAAFIGAVWARNETPPKLARPEWQVGTFVR